jgi:hypothetical protein
MKQKKRIKNPKISSLKKIMKEEKEKREKMGKGNTRCVGILPGIFPFNRDDF